MVKVKELLERLEQNHVKYVIIGGIAAIAHGSAYLTYDIDICYSRGEDNIKKLAEVLAFFNPKLRGAPPDLLLS
jgi:predicted nucleotidyltransferase